MSHREDCCPGPPPPPPQPALVRTPDAVIPQTISSASAVPASSQQAVAPSSSAGSPYPAEASSSATVERVREQEYNVVERSFFSLELGDPDELGDGVEYWRGNYESLRPTEMGLYSETSDFQITDDSARSFSEPLPVIDFIQRRIPLVSDRPTIILGADVTHPSPGEDSSPSIAAVVASMDWPEITKYRGLVSAQGHREEMIQDLYRCHQDRDGGIVHSGMIRELFIAFQRSTGQKPSRVIFYRDGVSDEGQFNQVLLYEMDAIRKACASLEEGYLPPVTFVVVHHTRLFPERGAVDSYGNVLPGTVVDTKICHQREFDFFRNGNVHPGTVVDTQICHQREFDFYLNSHASINGTSPPAHYHVLHDENGFSADLLQMLTNSLCYTCARCTRSVSIEGETSDGNSSGGRSSGTGLEPGDSTSSSY